MGDCVVDSQGNQMTNWSYDLSAAPESKSVLLAVASESFDEVIVAEIVVAHRWGGLWHNSGTYQDLRPGPAVRGTVFAWADLPEGPAIPDDVKAALNSMSSVLSSAAKVIEAARNAPILTDRARKRMEHIIEGFSGVLERLP